MNVWEMEQFNNLSNENYQLKQEIEKLKTQLEVLSPYQGMAHRTLVQALELQNRRNQVFSNYPLGVQHGRS